VTAPSRTAARREPLRPYAVTQAFLPLLARSSGAIVNNVSVMALARCHSPGYAISKAAAFNLTSRYAPFWPCRA